MKVRTKIRAGNVSFVGNTGNIVGGNINAVASTAFTVNQNPNFGSLLINTGTIAF